MSLVSVYLALVSLSPRAVPLIFRADIVFPFVRLNSCRGKIDFYTGRYGAGRGVSTVLEMEGDKLRDSLKSIILRIRSKTAYLKSRDRCYKSLKLTRRFRRERRLSRRKVRVKPSRSLSPIAVRRLRRVERNDSRARPRPTWFFTCSADDSQNDSREGLARANEVG